MSEVWEKRVDTHLVLRLQEHELGLAVFERDCVVGLDFDTSERVSASGDAVAH